MRKLYIILTLLLCAGLMLCGCGGERNADSANEAPPQGGQSTKVQPAEQPFEPKVCTLPDGKTAFDITAEQFIRQFNALYAERYGGEEYLRPLSGWLYERAEGARFGGEVCCYRFKEDNEIWTLGSVTLYTAPDDDRILELTVDLDDHGLSESLFRQFREVTLCTLDTLCPELGEEAAEELFSRMYIATDDIITPTDYMEGSTPEEFFYREGCVGVYPYFAYGEFIHICFAPAAEGE